MIPKAPCNRYVEKAVISSCRKQKKRITENYVGGRSELTVDAELGVLPTLIDDQDHDEQEGACKYSQAHCHRHLWK